MTEEKRPRSWEESVLWLREQDEFHQLVRDCYYDSPPERAAERYYNSDEWAAVRELLMPGRGKVLDIGAGHGITSVAFARDGWDVTALEPDGSKIVGCAAIDHLAKQYRVPIITVNEYAEEIPCEDYTFDLVFARQALHHAANLAGFCQEVQRVLKPGGIFLAVRDHVISRRTDLQKFLDRHPLHKFYGGENAYTLQEYIQAIEDGGLQIEVVLAPFESAINYAPITREGLREFITTKLSRIMGRTLASAMMSQEWLLATALGTMSRLDRRPGRLYSFRSRKPC